MIASYNNAKIKIVSSSRDANGVLTETMTDEIDARVEKNQKYIKGPNGIDVQVTGPIFIPADYVLTWDDKIIITEQYGSTALSNKKNAVKDMERVGGFKASHWEVWI